MSFCIRSEKCPFAADKVATLAGERGSLSVIEFLFQSGAIQPKTQPEAINVAAQSGHLHAVKLLHSYGWTWTFRTPYVAARYGHMHLVRFLLDSECPARLDVMAEGAAGSGYTDIVFFLFGRGAKVSERIASNAALNGHLTLFRALVVKKECEPSVEAYQMAKAFAESVLDTEYLQWIASACPSA